MNTLLRTTVLISGLSGVVSVPPAHATTANDTFEVSIKVANSCSVDANDLAFGTVTTLAANVDAATTVDVICTGIGPFSLAFNEGSGAGSTFAQRILNNGADGIDYNLYTTGGRTVILGDGTGGTEALTGTTTGGTDTLNIYGRVASGQNPKPVGIYTSDVIVTVIFGY